MNARQTVQKLSRDAYARVAGNKWVALALVVVLPGGFVLPICYGVYAAALRLRAPAERRRAPAERRRR